VVPVADALGVERDRRISGQLAGLVIEELVWVSAAWSRIDALATVRIDRLVLHDGAVEFQDAPIDATTLVCDMERNRLGPRMAA
jgi:hypothetical protein